MESQIIGELAYNSWRTMQARHETIQSACLDNDLALPDQLRVLTLDLVSADVGPQLRATAHEAVTATRQRL